MNVRHPVPDELLLDYAVGSAGPARSLLVASHLAMCRASRQRYALLQAVGGALLDSLEGRGLERISSESVLARADERRGNGAATAARSGRSAPEPAPPLGGRLSGIALPAPLARVARAVEGARAWRRLGWGVEVATLPVSTRTSKARLLRARAGTRIAKHTHLGDELVLILKGAYWDEGEFWGPGDVALNDPSSSHAPVVDAAEDCLCLAVTDGPIRFVGPLGPLLNLVVRF